MTPAVLDEPTEVESDAARGAETEIVRYRYRAYPNKKQVRQFARLFGCTRVVYNDALAYCRAEHAAGRGFPDDIQRKVLTEAKRTEARAFLAESYGVCLVQSVNDAKTAYRNFFDSLSGKRKGPLVRAPRMKSRLDNHHAARFSSAARFSVRPDPTDPDLAHLVLPGGLGLLRLAYSRALPDSPSSVTLTREPDGRHYVSFVVRRPKAAPRGAVGRIAGIDLGLSAFAHVLSTEKDSGTESVTCIETPAYLRRRERALARSQRSLARKSKGSNNRAKAVKRVAVVHRKVREARLDHAHQRATDIIAAHDVIATETLSLTGMARDRSTAKSVADQGLGQFVAILEEKAARAGVTLVKVGRYYPSTRTCSTCQRLTGPHGKRELGIRSWTCGTLPGRTGGCGTPHNRDINAARNILTEGLRILAHTPVADGQSETQNAHPMERKTARPRHPGASSSAGPDDGGRTTGDEPHAPA